MPCRVGPEHGRHGSGTLNKKGKGKAKWTKNGFGIATLILADNKLVILKADGHLVLAEASAEGYRQLSAARVSTDTCRALPALSEGRLYVRDERSLRCLDVGKR